MILPSKTRKKARLPLFKAQSSFSFRAFEVHKMLWLMEVLFLGREDESQSEFEALSLTLTGTCIVKIKRVLLDRECKDPLSPRKSIHENLSVDNSNVTPNFSHWENRPLAPL